MLETWTLTDGGQAPDDVADRLLAWLEPARRSLDLALYDVRLPGPVGDRVADAIRAAAARGVAVRIAYNQDERPPEDVERPFFPAPPVTEPHVLETLGRAGEADPRLARPHAPQVRRARRPERLDRLDELDAGLLDAAGERRGRGRVAGGGGGVRALLRAPVGPRAGRGLGRLRHGPRRRRAPVVLPRPRARALAADRQADRGRPPARADRLAAAHRRADPRDAGRGRRGGARGRRGRVRRDPGAPGLPPVGGEPALGLEGAAAAALPQGLHGEGVDAVRAGGRARLHARQADRGRRRRLPRLLQPVALGRGERRERARDRRPGAGGPARGIRRRAARALPAARGGRLAPTRCAGLRPSRVRRRRRSRADAARG